MENEKLLTIGEMANFLNVPISWLYTRTRIRGSDFPVVRVGKYCRFDPDAVMEWIKEKYGEVDI